MSTKTFYHGMLTGIMLSAAVGMFVLSDTPLQAAESEVNTDVFKEYYKTEAAVVVSPHGLRRHIEKGEFKGILVDLRSAEEYNEEHIIGAINIPAYKNREESDYGAVDRIVGEFRKLPKGKEIITYCYSNACMTGRKVGKMLAEQGIYVKHLGIGWNEWRHNWTAWNHQHEWDTTRPEDYIAKGSEPGVFKGNTKAEVSASCGEGSFSC